jgi:purine operon repressor
MSLARRSPVRGARVAYVDDFLKAGGTARAAADLLSEFQAEVSGVGVLVATATPTDKLVDGIHACLSWDESEGVRPAAWAAERVRPAAGLRADGLGPD